MNALGKDKLQVKGSRMNFRNAKMTSIVSLNIGVHTEIEVTKITDKETQIIKEKLRSKRQRQWP